MIIRVILLAAAIFLVLQAVAYIKKQPPQDRRKAILKCLGLLLIGVVVILAVTGRMHWVGAAIAIVFPFLKNIAALALRFMPFLRYLQQRVGPSVISTSILKVTVNFAQGTMNGEVLSGEFSGKNLDELDQSQLENLLAYCQQQDADSYRLLAAYMQRRFGQQQYQQQSSSQNTSSGTMNRKEALAVLGLDEDASEKDIITAHKKLMQKIHPDRGGSDYLAAKINQAKDVLLG